MFNMIMISMLSSLAMHAVQSLDKVLPMILAGFTWLFEAANVWRTGSTYVVTVERSYSKEPENVNNKILIDAILHGTDGGTVFSLENKSFYSDYENDLEHEQSRKLVLRKNQEFQLDDVSIFLKVTTRKVKKESKDGAEQTEEVPDKDILTLRSSKGIDHIQTFIETKRAAYIRETYSQQDVLYVHNLMDPKRYFLKFRRVQFSSKKNLDSWFFPQKRKLMKLVDDFVNASGPYAIPSVQKKLIILLHGEPGCGKTSFIKALANHLHRHLFPAALDQFMDLDDFVTFFRRAEITDAHHILHHVPFNRRIVVLEDIDTAGAVVMDRDKLKAAVRKQEDSLLEDYMPIIKSLRRKQKQHVAGSEKRLQSKQQRKMELQLASSKERADLERSLKIDLADGLLGQQDITERLRCFDQKVQLQLQSIESEDPEKSGDDDDPFQDAEKLKSGITLGDLLNVFDGINELEDFVCVITTNHKEYLDPALIRPGRITYELELTKMRTRELQEMLTFFYVQHNCHSEDELSEPEKVRMIMAIAKAWDGKHTASTIEQFCLRERLADMYAKVQRDD